MTRPQVFRLPPHRRVDSHSAARVIEEDKLIEGSLPRRCGVLTTDASAECYLIRRGATKSLEYTSGLPSSQGWYVLANLIRSASEG